MAKDALSEQLRKRLSATEKTGQPTSNVLGVVEATGGLFKLPAGELRQVCEPLAEESEQAATFLKAVADFPDGKEVVVPRLGLQAVLDGGYVEQFTETGADGVPTTKSRLVAGKRPKTPPAATKPKPGDITPPADK